VIPHDTIADADAPVRIVIEPTFIRGERGVHYRVRYADEVLIEDTWSPEYDAARALLALGITGKAEVWRDGKVASTMAVDLAAETTIVENANVGPRLGTWTPFSPYSVAPPAAVSGRTGRWVASSEDGLW
jgi:hypothetical protein